MWHNLLFSYHAKFIPVRFLMISNIFLQFCSSSLKSPLILKYCEPSKHLWETHSFQKPWHHVQCSLRLQFSISNFLMYHKVISSSRFSDVIGLSWKSQVSFISPALMAALTLHWMYEYVQSHVDQPNLESHSSKQPFILSEYFPRYIHLREQTHNGSLGNSREHRLFSLCPDTRHYR